MNANIYTFIYTVQVNKEINISKKNIRKYLLCVYTVYTFTLMETITLISYSRTKRAYFFSDWDEAKAFERMFDGDFAYSENGYTITI